MKIDFFWKIFNIFIVVEANTPPYKGIINLSIIVLYDLALWSQPTTHSAMIEVLIETIIWIPPTLTRIHYSILKEGRCLFYENLRLAHISKYIFNMP